MEAIQFKRAELEDQEIIAHYFEHHTSRSCERTFANVYSKVKMRITYLLRIRQERRKM